MQVNSKSHIRIPLTISLLAVVSIWAIAYFSDQKIAILTSDFVYIPLTIMLTITAFFQVYQIRNDQRNILMWYAFAIFALTYSIAQHIWSLNEIILDTKPFPSLADVAFTISTVSIIVFLILIVKSKKQFISKWMYGVAIPSGCFVIILSTYFFITSNPDLTLDSIMSFAYPVLDSIALVPALLGVIMYFRNKVDFAICLICFAMIPLTTGDVLFQYTSANGTYYSGSIADLFFYIQITLLIFGVYMISNSKVRTNVSVK